MPKTARISTRWLKIAAVVMAASLFVGLVLQNARLESRLSQIQHAAAKTTQSPAYLPGQIVALEPALFPRKGNLETTALVLPPSPAVLRFLLVDDRRLPFPRYKVMLQDAFGAEIARQAGLMAENDRGTWTVPLSLSSELFKPGKSYDVILWGGGHIVDIYNVSTLAGK